MKTLSGKINSSGIAIGPLFCIRSAACKIEDSGEFSIEKEIAKLDKAKAEAELYYDNLYERTMEQVGEEEAQIFFIHKIMLDDEDYYEAIVKEISDNNLFAAKAVVKIQNKLIQELKETGDDVIEERCSDLKEISEVLLSCLSGKKQCLDLPDNPVVIYAKELTPAQTVQFDKSKILAFITENGAKNSHTAILARSMGIPAVTAVPESSIEDAFEGVETVVDGNTGKVVIAPESSVLQEYKKIQAKENADRQELLSLVNKETVTKDGQKVLLFANIGNQGDVAQVQENGGEGIGLFRSEFLYLGRNDYPDEETLFQAYKSVAQGMKGKQVVIRTIDIGADKQADYFEMPAEENPAMGVRAIRLCFARKPVFLTQLKAILRASKFGNVAIMFPMIISVDEVYQAKECLEEAKKELKAANIAYEEDIKVGIMIETPASVIMSDKLAAVSDFFSIGTNDLTQYTLAMDRQNESFTKTLDEYRTPVLRMIEMTVKNAHEAGIPVCICEELAAEDELTEEFVRMGVDKLSVVPGRILRLRRKINSLSLK